ncbi:MAG: efflux RND transporter periplasmic adaptor subunit [Alphaproteobacteria bacterium]|nr:efflux RND transporter periplasmic adaptor subunit [Alphaproteobacteria bacterium]MDE2109739.1 efflux RND transporter periplasmic adaptor subunit [Alphaproteobacteria bacterium]MDE2494363.1 efflux RND transporter periplasmic adaptor subunit [Alphaproteobacteria bacterium]
MKRLSLALVLLLAGCGQHNDHAWLGYAEGDYAFISAPQAGWVTNVAVGRGAWVKKGDLLFALDDTSQIAARDSAQAAIAQAEGQMGQAQASLDLARKELTRQEGLLHASATSKQAYDQAKSNYDTAAALVAQIEANENQARASLDNAAYQLSQRDIVSRTEGRVQDVYFRQGEYAPAMTPVISLLPPQNVYVRFFVPEDEFAKIHLGDKVKISCDGCAANIVATVTFIASREEYTPPVIFSNASRQQLVYKIEARAPGGLKLHPGQPVDVRPL